MFRKKKPETLEQAVAKVKRQPEPQKTPEQVEAEKIVARGELIKRLGQEAGMWRVFAAGCKPGREIYEHPLYCGWEVGLLHVAMNEDTTPMWLEFANNMADHADRKLKEALCIC